MPTRDEDDARVVLQAKMAELMGAMPDALTTARRQMQRLQEKIERDVETTRDDIRRGVRPAGKRFRL